METYVKDLCMSHDLLTSLFLQYKHVSDININDMQWLHETDQEYWMVQIMEEQLLMLDCLTLGHHFAREKFHTMVSAKEMHGIIQLLGA